MCATFLLPQETSVLRRIFFFLKKAFPCLNILDCVSHRCFCCQLHIHGWSLRTKCKRCCFCQMQLLMLHTYTGKLLTNIGFSFIRSVWSELVVCDCWILVSSPSLYRWLRSHIFHLTKSSVVIGYFRIAQFKRPSQPELCQLLYFPSTWNNNISVQLAQYKLKVLKFVWSSYSTTATKVV